jgi:HAD superfamily hydrolase (TIGR01509 family)
LLTCFNQNIPVHILFDLDGVLLDSQANMEASWSAVRATHGVPTAFHEYFRRIGKPFGDILDELGIHQNQKEIAKTYAAASKANKALLRLMPGVAGMLPLLITQGHRLGILTSKDPDRTAETIQHFKLPVEASFSPTSELRGKPEPDLFYAAAEHWKTPPEHLVYIGDMAVDEEAATRIGARYIHVSWGYGEPVSACATIARDPAHLVQLVEDLDLTNR